MTATVVEIVETDFGIGASELLAIDIGPQNRDRYTHHVWRSGSYAEAKVGDELAIDPSDIIGWESEGVS